MSAQAGIPNETARLMTCALFGPGDELDRMLPRHLEPYIHAPADSGVASELRENPDYLLFDDLVLLPLLRDEHAELAAVIRAVTGPQGCLDIRAMAAEVLSQPEVAAAVLDQALADPQLTPLARMQGKVRLEKERGIRLVEALIQGVAPGTETPVFSGPAPNLLFARDLWARVGDAIVLGHPRHPARRRDGVISRAIAKHHRQFADVPLIDLHEGEKLTAGICLEGGDVLVAGPNLVLVGHGPRTTLRAAEMLAARLPASVEVLGVRLPFKRATMHLDTLLTFVDSNAVLAFTPAFDPQTAEGERCEVTDLRTGRVLGPDLPAILGDRLGGIEVVACGDGDPVAAVREQWTDGANAVCLAPGRIVMYTRNTRTLRALNRAGFEVMNPAQFAVNADLYLRGDRRLVVAVGGAELSRGRGGPRCLTLPISRVAAPT